MHSNITKAALLLAVMIVVQSIRLIVPVPPFISMFVIGSGVNACLLLAVEQAGWRLAAILAVTAPVIAALQQFLPTPLFILPVAIANLVYVAGYQIFFKVHRWLAVVVATLFKMAAIYTVARLVIKIVDLPERLAAALLLLFGYPQLITGVAGGAVCCLLVRRLTRRRFNS